MPFILNKRQLKVLFEHWNFDRGFQIEPINTYTFQILEYAHMRVPVLVCACVKDEGRVGVCFKCTLRTLLLETKALTGLELSD